MGALAPRRMQLPVIMGLVLLLLPHAHSTCHDHNPCCVCLENVCGKSRGSLSECEACTVKNISLMTGPICNCVEGDFDPWCRTKSWGCECNENTHCKCMPSVSGSYPSQAGTYLTMQQATRSLAPYEQATQVVERQSGSDMP
jgi:hypothetical protein